VPPGLFLFLLALENSLNDLGGTGFHELDRLLLEDIGILEGSSHKLIDHALYVLIQLTISELLLSVAHGHYAPPELLLMLGYINLELFLELSPLVEKLYFWQTAHFDLARQ
jgi:hypothetical protein